MKRIVPTLALIMTLSAAMPGVALAADGQALFLSNKCNKCHTIDAKGIAQAKKEGADDGDDDSKKKPSDLSSVGNERDAAWLTKWLKKEVEIDRDGKKIKHKKIWKGTDDELKAVVDFMASMKAPAKAK